MQWNIRPALLILSIATMRMRFCYVLEGSIIMQVKGGKEVTLTPGQTFYEGPEDIHVVGRNAKQNQAGKIHRAFGEGQRRSGADPYQLTAKHSILGCQATVMGRGTRDASVRAPPVRDPACEA